MTDISLTTTRTISAPAEQLYTAWITPESMARFFCNCDGAAAAGVTSDARVGGKFFIPMPTPGGIVDHAGEYLELKPHEKIVFTWNSKHVNEGTTVTLTFKPVEGGTEITLTHVKFSDEGTRNGHLKGWTAILDAFEASQVAEPAA
ncbi:MAG: SRPBCC domain-containing protein [Vannielia sp.]|uniref:SRPBCC family protein n=1 Tax=Vannielia sp. TaxID=2813045 RepID=UPI003B8E82E6